MGVQEEKNVLLGQLFLHASLLQAHRLGTAQDAEKSITALFKVAHKRSFLYEACVSTVLDIIDALPSDEAMQLIDTHADIQTMLQCPADQASPEALMLALHLWPLLSKSSRKACKLLPEGVCQPSLDLFKDSPTQAKSSTNGKTTQSNASVHSEADKVAAEAFFTTSNLQSVGHVLKDASFVRHQLHAVWLHVLRLLIPSFVVKGHKGTTETGQQPVKYGHVAAVSLSSTGSATQHVISCPVDPLLWQKRRLGRAHRVQNTYHDKLRVLLCTSAAFNASDQTLSHERLLSRVTCMQATGVGTRPTGCTVVYCDRARAVAKLS